MSFEDSDSDELAFLSHTDDHHHVEETETFVAADSSDRPRPSAFASVHNNMPQLKDVWPANNTPVCGGSCLMGPNLGIFSCNLLLITANTCKR